MSYRNLRKKTHKIRNTILIILGIIIVSGTVMMVFKIDTIKITGNQKTSDEEVISSVFSKNLDYHTVYFYVKNKLGLKESMPFVESYEINFKSLKEVEIWVYEKRIIGCVEYMGSYMYFDQDGIVTQSSSTPFEDAPVITGLDYGYVVINEKLPVDNKEVFDILLNITQLLKKYEIKVDKINLSEKNDLQLYIGQIKIDLGSKKNLNEKISDLRNFIGKLDGMSGTLDMRTYNPNSQEYTFKKDATE